jgi:hypothetical protein
MIFVNCGPHLGWWLDQYGGFIAMYRSWSDHMEAHSTARPRQWGIVNYDPCARVKLGPSRRQFLPTAAAPRGAAMLPASLRMDEAFAQRRLQHAGRLRAQGRRRPSISNSTSAPAPSIPLAAEVASDGMTVNSICPGPVAPNLPPVAREVAQAQAQRTGRSDALASRRMLFRRPSRLR